MNSRIICPHCHRPIDPLLLEDAVSDQAHYLICPECDDPIALPAAMSPAAAPLPAPAPTPVESLAL